MIEIKLIFLLLAHDSTVSDLKDDVETLDSALMPLQKTPTTSVKKERQLATPKSHLTQLKGKISLNFEIQLD